MFDYEERRTKNEEEEEEEEEELDLYFLCQKVKKNKLEQEY